MKENDKICLITIVIDQNLPRISKTPKKEAKMTKKCHKNTPKKPKTHNFGPPFGCYTEARLEIQVGLLAALADGPPGFLGGLR